jgi:hypothetical protein
VLAGWLAASPPSNAPDSATSASTPPAMPGGAAAPDIAREAERLQVRVRREVVYAQPQRNPFRFGSGAPRARGGGDVAASAIPADVPDSAAAGPDIPATPAPPVLTLSGIAEDEVDQRPVRTAILSSPSGVLLVREGDQVLGLYRVARIESGAVELVAIADGTTRRIALKP